MSRSLIAALLAILGLTAFGLYERHVGAVHAQAVLALQADSVRQDSTNRVYLAQRDSALAKVAVTQATTSRALHLAAIAKSRGDSLEAAMQADTSPTVNRDSALAVVAVRDTEIVHLREANGSLAQESDILLLALAQRDTTISALNSQLTALRAQLAKALTPSRWRFPCAAGPFGATNKGIGWGLAVGACYAL